MDDPPNYPNVSYERLDRAPPGVVDRPAVALATEALREIMGEMFDQSQIIWSIDNFGSGVGYRYGLGIRIPSWGMNYSHNIHPLEISDRFARPFALRSKWGMMLKDYNRRLAKKQPAGGG